MAAPYRFWDLLSTEVALNPRTLAYDLLLVGCIGAIAVLFARLSLREASSRGYRVAAIHVAMTVGFAFAGAGFVVGMLALNGFRTGEIAIPRPEPGPRAAGAALIVLALAIFVALFGSCVAAWVRRRVSPANWRPSVPNRPRGEYALDGGGQRAARHVSWSEHGIQVETNSGERMQSTWDEIERVKAGSRTEGAPAWLVLWVHLRSGGRFALEDRGRGFMELADALYCHCPSACWLKGSLDLPSQRG